MIWRISLHIGSTNVYLLQILYGLDEQLAYCTCPSLDTVAE